MPESQSRTTPKDRTATSDDVVSILGHIDQDAAHHGLRPKIADIEQASSWLGGDRDVFEPGQPLKGIASEIVTILTADEEEEPPRPT